jgi:hypothetical protein
MLGCKDRLTGSKIETGHADHQHLSSKRSAGAPSSHDTQWRGTHTVPRRSEHPRCHPVPGLLRTCLGSILPSVLCCSPKSQCPRASRAAVFYQFDRKRKRNAETADRKSLKFPRKCGFHCTDFRKIPSLWISIVGSPIPNFMQIGRILYTVLPKFHVRSSMKYGSHWTDLDGLCTAERHYKWLLYAGQTCGTCRQQCV